MWTGWRFAGIPIRRIPKFMSEWGGDLRFCRRCIDSLPLSAPHEPRCEVRNECAVSLNVPSIGCCAECSLRMSSSAKPRGHRLKEGPFADNSSPAESFPFRWRCRCRMDPQPPSVPLHFQCVVAPKHSIGALPQCTRSLPEGRFAFAERVYIRSRIRMRCSQCNDPRNPR